MNQDSANAPNDTSLTSITSVNTSQNGGRQLTPHQRETAQYVADMILEMRNMAKAAQLYTVTVPLEFAYYEAYSVANFVEIPPDERERLEALGKSAAESDAVVRLNSMFPAK
jgi:hypothetical protein